MFLPIKLLSALTGGLLALCGLKTLVTTPTGLAEIIAVAPGLAIGLIEITQDFTKVRVIEPIYRKIFRSPE